MWRASAPSLLLLLLLACLALGALGSEKQLVEDVLEENDECAAGEDCALSALQLRKGQMSAASSDNEVQSKEEVGASSGVGASASKGEDKGSDGAAAGAADSFKGDAEGEAAWINPFASGSPGQPGQSAYGGQPMQGAYGSGSGYGGTPTAHTTFPASHPFCADDTGGTCNIGGCSESRGQQVTCQGDMFAKKCLCHKGFCAKEGRCVPWYHKFW